MKKNPGLRNLTYDIIGYGNAEAIEKVMEAIRITDLKSQVIFHGRKKVTELDPFLEKASCGVVYIPLKSYYDSQPPTKLFEYLLAGIPVIATNTAENRNNLHPGCGITIQDNSQSFCEGLESFQKELGEIDPEAIKDLYKDFEWKNIVKKHLVPLIQIPPGE
jgi:glycosyltransferase involved in cell wall biosynthesis